MPLTIGLYMLVRDETDVLTRCLESFKGVYDDLVIVVNKDSPASTKVIAGHYTKSVYEIPEPDDFAAARNYAESKLETDWRIWADADDIFKGDPKKLREFVKKSDKEGYNVISMTYIYGFEGDRATSSGGVRRRVHKKDIGAWKYKSHELYIPKDEIAKEIFYPDAAYWHHKTGERDTLRNVRLQENAIKTASEEDLPRYYNCLAREYRCLGRTQEAVEYFKKYVQLKKGIEAMGEWYELAGCLFELKDYPAAKRAAFEAILINPYYKYPYSLMGQIYAAEENWPQVIIWMRAALEIDPYGWDRLANCMDVQGEFDDEATITYVPWEYIGLAYWHMDDYKSAHESYIHCLEWKPDDPVIKGYLKDLRRYLAEDSIK